MPNATTASLLSCLALVSACQGDDRISDSTRTDDLQTILVVVMDGVRLEESLGDSVSSASQDMPADMMPMIWSELAPHGYRSTNTWSITSTNTAPAHATLLSGRRLPYANFAMGLGPGLYRPLLPVLHELLEQAGAIQPDGAHFIVNTPLLEGLASSLWPWPDGVDVGPASHQLVSTNEGVDIQVDDRETLMRLRETLQEQPVEFALVNLHEVDRAGHDGDGQDYPEAVRDLDEPIHNLWSWIQESPRYADSTWMVLVADHGRNSLADTDPVWRHHGDQCNGCRRLPFMLLGPGVRGAADGDSPIMLVDIAPTLAALRGVPSPWADGLVRDDLLEFPTLLPSREGVADLARAGGHTALLLYRDDPSHRKTLELDHMEVSSPDAIEVEAPVMAADGARAWLCFRELVLTPQEETTQWEARCLATDDDGSSWQDIGGPTDPVGPWWHATLVPSADGVLALYSYNPDGLANTSGVGSSRSYWVEAAQWDGYAWTRTMSDSEMYFPTNLTTVTQNDGGLLVAVAASSQATGSRNTRSIFTGAFRGSSQGQTWNQLIPTDLRGEDISLEDNWRVEHPALHLDSLGEAWLAAVAFSDEGTHGVVAWDHSTTSWLQQDLVELPGQPLPHIAPVWVGDRPVWAILDGSTGLVELCVAFPDEQARCVGTGSERVLRMIADAGEILAIVDRDQGLWELLELDAEELGIGE